LVDRNPVRVRPRVGEKKPSDKSDCEYRYANNHYGNDERPPAQPLTLAADGHV
jgi:hypothetical protein